MSGHRAAQDGTKSPGVVNRALAGRLVLVCRLAVAICALLVAGILAIPVALVSVRVWDWNYLIVLGGFAVGMGAYLVLAATPHCPACGRHFLMESTGPRHPAAGRERHFDIWGPMIWAVTRRREITRMYCGRVWDLP